MNGSITLQPTTVNSSETMHAKANMSCPLCGAGRSAYYPVLHPRDGCEPFWTCDHCSKRWPIEGGDPLLNGSAPRRELTPDQIEQAQYGYVALASAAAEAIWKAAEIGAGWSPAPLGLEYLRTRGLTDDTVREVGLGYHIDHRMHGPTA